MLQSISSLIRGYTVEFAGSNHSSQRSPQASPYNLSSNWPQASVKMLLGADRAVGSMHASCNGRPVARPVLGLPRRISRHVVSEVACGGLKKETKKLAKTLKTHRKRLESMLASAVTSPQAASQLQLQAVLAEMSQLQDALQSVRALQEQIQVSSDSSDSDSDSDREEGYNQRRKAKAAMRVSSMVLSGAAVSTAVLESPAVDQGMPDITQQLPPPQQYSNTGRILVCQGKACMSKGALPILQAASHAASASPGIEIIPCKCLGKCKQGPAMRLRNQQPGCMLLTEVSPLDVPGAVEQVFGQSSGMGSEFSC